MTTDKWKAEAERIVAKFDALELDENEPVQPHIEALKEEIARALADAAKVREGCVSFADLSRANAERHKEWDPSDAITLAFRGNELAGETGEACNVIKKLERERLGLRGSRATKDQLGEELADVVICADLCAMTAGIDLGAAVAAKFNATSEKYGLATRLEAALAAAEAANQKGRE